MKYLLHARQKNLSTGRILCHAHETTACKTLKLPGLTVFDGIPIIATGGLVSTGLEGTRPGYNRRPPGKPLYNIVPAPVVPLEGTAWLSTGADRLIIPAPAGSLKDKPDLLTCGPGKEPGNGGICEALGLPIGGWVIPPVGGTPELEGGGNPGWCIGDMEGAIGGPGGRLVGAPVCCCPMDVG